MKKLVALEPRVAGLKEYEERTILEDEVLIKVKFASPNLEQKSLILEGSVHLSMMSFLQNGICLCHVRQEALAVLSSAICH